MILIDVNLLLYAHVNSFKQHAAARAWLDAQLNGLGPVGLPWASLLAFVRLATNRRVIEIPTTVAEAMEQVETWLGLSSTWVPEPTPRHSLTLRSLLLAAGGGGDLVPDAHLAALSIEHGLTVCSADSDFARFPGVRWMNPLRP